MDVLSNEIFEDLDITNLETSEFINNNPNIANYQVQKLLVNLLKKN